MSICESGNEAGSGMSICESGNEAGSGMSVYETGNNQDMFTVYGLIFLFIIFVCLFTFH